MLSQQSGLYVNTADQLVELVRSTLLNAWYIIILQPVELAALGMAFSSSARN